MPVLPILVAEILEIRCGISPGNIRLGLSRGTSRWNWKVLLMVVSSLATKETGLVMGAVHKSDVGLFKQYEIEKTERGGKRVQVHNAK